MQGRLGQHAMTDRDWEVGEHHRGIAPPTRELSVTLVSFIVILICTLALCLWGLWL